MNERLLIVDDERVLRENLARYLTHKRYKVDAVASAEAALERLAVEDYGLVITDIRMPGMDGLALLEQITAHYPETLVLLITAYASVESAVNALRLGAQDYLLKPLILDEVAEKVRRLLDYRALQVRVRRLRQEVQQRYEVDGMVAESPPMVRVNALIDKAARTPANVLIEGETGTGKELVARALHDRSQLAERDFIPVNLSALPPDMVDATLFGHERGAFTGASRGRPGVFRAVNGGTVFLDEIGDLPAPVQVKLLRVIESREVFPIGGDRPLSVDFRLVAATNRPLAEGVAKGSFRQDLYYRLNVLTISLPPLRERPEDIQPLAARFLKRHARAFRRPTPRLSNEALRLLAAYRWPGNVRELSNVLERAVLIGDSDWVSPADLPDELLDVSEPPLALKAAVRSFEQRHVADVLRRCQGNKAEAAEVLGVHVATLYRHLERLEDD